MTDFSFDLDHVIGLIVSALLLAHIGALVWAGWLRNGRAPVLALNLFISGGAVLYWGLHIADLEGSIDLVWAFVAYEFVVLVTSLLAVIRMRVPQFAIWIEFAAHALMNGLALLFILTFHLTRLI